MQTTPFLQVTIFQNDLLFWEGETYGLLMGIFESYI